MHSCSGLQTLTLKVSVSLLHFCRILHLAIIHEEESIAQQLIQLFPKNVLDIQNNLYQVSAVSPLPQQLLLEFFIIFFPLTATSSLLLVEMTPLFFTSGCF